MRLVQQTTVLPIENFDSYAGGAITPQRHGPLLPSNVRCLAVGPSNCGKTNAVFNMLFHENGLRFENVYVFSKSLIQPKYEFLQFVLPKEIGYFAFDDNADVIHPRSAKPNSIFIFDDISCEKHNNIRDYFSMGRHNHIDTFYLGQTYSRIPKQLIRDNANMLVLFKQDDMNLRHIYSDHVNTDMTFETFKLLCSLAWKDKYGFLVVSKDSDFNEGRYRKQFDSYIVDINSDDKTLF